MTSDFIKSDFNLPDHRAFLGRLRLFLLSLGGFFLLLGLLRMLVANFGADLAETYAPQFFNTPSLLLAALYLAAAYLALYAWAGIGALSPGAMRAIRWALIGLGGALLATALYALWVNFFYGLLALILAGGGLAAAYWFWRELAGREVWRVFGHVIHRQEGPNPLVYVVVILGLVIFLAIGAVYAYLTNLIEVPLPATEPGQILYATSFDDFNDEWDLPRGRQAAEVREGELFLTEGTGYAESGFYAYLESRPFRDFDLRLQTRQVGGDNDNSYGVVFRWRDVNNYYRFEISGDGYYRLSRTEDGQTENITQWIPSEVIQQGQASNQIRILAEGDQFRFYVNGELMRLCTRGSNREALVNPLTGECVTNDWQDRYRDDSFAQGRIGLLVGTTQTTDTSSPVVIAFDNLLITGP
jgi:hypothetical protein